MKIMNTPNTPNIWVPSRKYVDGGIDIDLRPKCEWRIDIQDTDGTVRPARGFECGFRKNVILNQYRDLLSSWNDSGYFGACIQSPIGTNNPGFRASRLRIGTDGTAAVATQTTLLAYSKESTAFYPSGNSISANPSTGAIVVTSKQTFAAEAGSATYREAGLYFFREADAAATYANRFVFPSPISMTVGQVIIMTMAFTFPSVYNNPQTVTLSADNGVNISGRLGLIGALASICSGSVTAAGVWTGTSKWGYRPRVTTVAAHAMPSNSFALTGHNTFATAGTDGTNLISGVTNSITALPATTSSIAAYASGSYVRNHTGNWAPGNPVTATTFNSLMMAGTDGTTGYQLLFDAPQSFASTSALSFSVSISV